jgi:competence protein ComEC
LVAFFLGAARYQSSLPNLSDPGFITAHTDTGDRVVVTGVISDFPDRRDAYLNLRVQVESLRPAEGITHTTLRGLLLAQTAPELDFHYGDRVVLEGQLLTPPEGDEFSYREYLAHQGIYAYMPRAEAALLESGLGNPIRRLIYAIRERALEVVYQLWPDPEASLLAGILSGLERGISEPAYQAFRETGNAHVIAISGFNITIVAGLFSTLFGRIFNPRRGALAAILGIAVYTILVGADPAVVRAAIMGGFALFARQIGRRQHGLNILLVSAALMVLFDPQLPWDVGFQLSFAATLGLVLYAEPLTGWFTNIAERIISPEGVQRLVGPISEYLLFTLAAQITTLPVIAYHFQRVSWISFLANPVILPAQPPIMILGGLAVLMGLVWVPLGRLVGTLAWPFVVFTIRAVELFGDYSGGMLVLGEFGLLSVSLYCALIFGFTFAGSRIRERLTAFKPAPVVAVLSIAAVLVWRAALSAHDGRLHLTFLDVGTGEAVLVTTPSGRYALIDGGPSPSRLSDGLGRRLPLFHRQLDFLIVASPRQDAIAALPRVVARFPPANVLWCGPPSPSRAGDDLRSTLIEAGIEITPAQAGQSLDLGQGAELRVLTSGSRGAILLLEWGSFRALLPLGADYEDLESLGMGRDVDPVTALLLAEGGFSQLNPPEWIQNLRPQLVLLSIAPDNPDGLPDRETMEALGGYSLLRTDRNGWIHISTDGEQMWVEVERR